MNSSGIFSAIVIVISFEPAIWQEFLHFHPFLLLEIVFAFFVAAVVFKT